MIDTDIDRVDPCGCRLQLVDAGMDSGEGWEVYEPCASHRGDDPLAETDADWRGTPLRPGALAVWVVGNARATEGRVISWDREYVTVQPARHARRVQGGVARASDFETRPQTVPRLKLTVLEGARP